MRGKPLRVRSPGLACKGKKKRRRANVVMKGQNGATVRGKQSVVRCGKKKRKRRR